MQHPNDPLHGITLEALLNALVAQYGWAELAKRININCFKSEPSIKSSLKFLRRTPWARKEVEALYIDSLSDTDTAKAEAPADNPWAHWQKVGAQRIIPRAPGCVLLKIACGQALFIKGMADINMILMHGRVDI
jgi:uncharacterized protein (DUF2132 family)